MLTRDQLADALIDAFDEQARAFCAYFSEQDEGDVILDGTFNFPKLAERVLELLGDPAPPRQAVPGDIYHSGGPVTGPAPRLLIPDHPRHRLKVAPGETLQVGDWLTIDWKTGHVRKARPEDTTFKFPMPPNATITGDGKLEMDV